MIRNSWSRFTGRAVAALLMAVVLTLNVAFAADTRGPSGCPPGVDSAKWICLTREEAQKIKLDKLDLQDKVIDLREELAKARLAAPSGIRKYVNPWATVGLERGLNDGKYQGYATGGVTFGGHVNLWAGVWGSEPSVGAGWSF